MAAVTLTNREIKNKATGLDIRVPQYEHISGSFGGSVTYHVIVVTQLFYFKTPGKHKESDIVQFMIPQRYEAFEELCLKLSQKFPSVVFDPPPKKPFIINDAVMSERRQYMEDVLQKIAKTPKLACSSMLLEFLGAKRGHKEINRLEETQSNQKEEDSSEKTNTQQETVEDVDLFANTDKTDGQAQDNEDEEELFTGVKSSPLPTAQAKGFSIFRADDKEDDEDINDLFIPAGADERKKIDVEVEDNSKLLEIEDDLDKLLSVKPKPQKPPKPSKPVAKPRLKPKPDLKPKPTPKPRFAEAAAGEDELFGGAAADQAAKDKKKKPPVAKERKADEDLFDQARKSSFNRTSSHEEETLDDIFNTPSRPAFTTEDDDDLFKQTASGIQDMSADDIASYIQQNTWDSNTKLDLF